MTVMPADAGNVVEKPDPELLKKFEAEREAARAGQQQAREKIEAGEAKIKRAEQELREVQQETDRKLCEMGALPPNLCP